MNINWKSRLTNKTFWVSIVSSVVLLTQQLGYNIFPSNWADILNTILTIFILLGIIVDTSTPGICDNILTSQVNIAKKDLANTNQLESQKIVQAATDGNNQTVASDNSASQVDTSTTSSKIIVDNPDNIQQIGATVNHTSANMPQ